MRVLLAIVFLASACKGDKGESAVPAETGLCADAPVLMWANFGQGFVLENCQSCHASTSLDRNDAPEEVSFDTLEQVRALSDRILARAAGAEPTMPPEGGVGDEDREKLELWLSCWLEQDPG